MELAIENATWYDHAKNSLPPARGWAMAKVRRELIDEGKAYTVIGSWNGGEKQFWWNGSHYDVLGLAKSIVSNRGIARMIAPNGKDVDIVKARY